MAGIGIITMLSQLRGAYALAGAVAATFSLSTALLAPWISRRVDRHGQTRVLPLAAALSILALAGLAAGAHGNWPDWTLFVCAAAAGVMPSMPAMVGRAGVRCTATSRCCARPSRWNRCWTRSR